MSTILITGATSGIGEATAEYLSEQGYSLVLLGRNAEKVSALKDKIENCVWAYCVDLIDIEKIKGVFEDLQKHEIKLSGLVHSAGLEGELAPVRSIKSKVLEELMRLHYVAFVEMGKYFYKKSISHDGASIIGLSSLAVNACTKGATDYACSKAAMNIAVKIMAKEFLKRHIRVNTIMPANVTTPMTSKLEEVSDVESEQPWGMIDAKQIAYMIEFLLSDRSRFITGANIPISAGMIF